MSSLRGLLASECDIQQLQVELPLWHDGRELERKGCDSRRHVVKRAAAARAGEVDWRP